MHEAWQNIHRLSSEGTLLTKLYILKLYINSLNKCNTLPQLPLCNRAYCSPLTRGKISGPDIYYFAFCTRLVQTAFSKFIQCYRYKNGFQNISNIAITLETPDRKRRNYWGNIFKKWIPFRKTFFPLLQKLNHNVKRYANVIIFIVKVRID